MQMVVNGWFCICEAQFELRHITSKHTKFCHVISFLSPGIISSLLPTIIAAKKYTELNDVVLARHKQTKPEMFKKLLVEKKMIGRPSTL